MKERRYWISTALKSKCSEKAARSQHERDTSHSSNQHGSVRADFVQLLGKQLPMAIHNPKTIAVCIEQKCVHTSSLFISTVESEYATIQQFGLGRYEISRWYLSHLTVTNRAHRSLSSWCRASGVESIFAPWKIMPHEQLKGIVLDFKLFENRIHCDA